MLIFAIILLMLFIFNITAWYWGADSADNIDSHEWVRRQLRGFRL